MLSFAPRTFEALLRILALLAVLPWAISGCEQAHAEDGPKSVRLAASPAVSENQYPVTIHRPYPELGMNVGLVGPDGKAARTPCRTCHGFVEAKEKYEQANRLEAFHQGVEILHGGQSCRTCHAVPGFDAFNLAGGEKVSYDEVMRLCGQCHAQRLVEYQRGVHGGMTGYWDLSRGPRSRNHCLDCHNPHAPAIPQMVPAPALVNRTFE